MFSRVFGKLDADAFNAALHGYAGSLPQSPAGDLPEVTRHEREQRRAAAAAADACADSPDKGYSYRSASVMRPCHPRQS
jgi:hypothetical protein